MYDSKSNLVIGFHGCERRVRDQLLMNPNDYKISQKPFDWLGHGLYFWENNYDRALEWATDKKHRGKIEHPAVVGAVLSLGYCCDFLEKRYIKLLAYYFDNMKSKYELLGQRLPQNRDLKQDRHKDKILRELDCAAIEFMHSEILEQYRGEQTEKGYSEYKIFDSTRGVELYSGFFYAKKGDRFY